jgi:uncharacterized membrane protein HdeD (DUF308 family)
MVSDQRSAVASSWWLVLIYGIFVGVIGILLLGQPEKTLPVLVTLMGIMWLIQGMFMIGSSFMGGEGWGWRLFGGILSSIAGFIAIAYPIMSTAVTLMVMVYILAFTAIFNGIAEIFTGRRFGQVDSSWSWGSFFLGLLHLIIGIALLSQSFLSAQVLVLVVAFAAIFKGIGMVVFSFRLKSAAA